MASFIASFYINLYLHKRVFISFLNGATVTKPIVWLVGFALLVLINPHLLAHYVIINCLQNQIRQDILLSQEKKIDKE